MFDDDYSSIAMLAGNISVEVCRWCWWNSNEACLMSFYMIDQIYFEFFILFFFKANFSRICICRNIKWNWDSFCNSILTKKKNMKKKELNRKRISGSEAYLFIMEKQTNIFILFLWLNFHITPQWITIPTLKFLCKFVEIF